MDNDDVLTNQQSAHQAKTTYLELLNRAYVNMQNDNVIDKPINNDFVRVNMTFDKYFSDIHFKIKIPSTFNEQQFILFILSVLSIKRLKYLIKISVKLYNCDNLDCFDYIKKCPYNGIYNLKDANKWNKYRKFLYKNFEERCKDAIDAIICHS